MPTAKLKIGFVFDSSLDSNDGVAHQVKTLGKWLSENGHQVSYLVGETKADDYAGDRIFSMSKNINVTFNGNKVSIPLSVSRKSIKSVIAGQKFDILHVQLPHSPFMAAKVVKLAHKDSAIVGTFHILPYGKAARFGSKLLGLMLRSNLKLFDQIVSVSEPAKEF